MYRYVGNSPTTGLDPLGTVDFSFWMWWMYNGEPTPGLYAYGGYGAEGPKGGVEFGLGMYCDRDGLNAGLEYYAYAGGTSGIPYVGGGRWDTWGGHGSGPVFGWGPGILQVEGYYDTRNHQSYIGVAGGEGFRGAFGICVDGNIFSTPPQTETELFHPQ